MFELRHPIGCLSTSERRVKPQAERTITGRKIEVLYFNIDFAHCLIQVKICPTFGDTHKTIAF